MDTGLKSSICDIEPRPTSFFYWLATFAFSYSFSSLCVAESLIVPADGEGVRTKIRRQPKTVGLFLSILTMVCEFHSEPESVNV